MNRQNLLAIGLILSVTTGCHSMGGGSFLSKHKRDKHEEVICQCGQCYRPLYPGDTWGQRHGRKHSKRHKHDQKNVYAMTWSSGAAYGGHYGVPYGLPSASGGPVHVQFGYPAGSDCGCVDSMTAGWADDCGCDQCATYITDPCGCDACGGELYPPLAAVHGQQFIMSNSTCATPQMFSFTPAPMNVQMAGPTCSAPREPACSAPVEPACSAPAAATCAVPAPTSCAMPGMIMPTPDCASQQLMIPGSPYEQTFPAAVPPADNPGHAADKIPVPPDEKPIEQNFQAPAVNPPGEQPAPAADPIQQTSWNTLQVPPSPFPPVPNIRVPNRTQGMNPGRLSMPIR